MAKISTGVTLYNPDISRLEANLNNCALQTEKIYIVDNGSANLDDIKKLIKNYKNIALIENDKNLGIAKALNQLFEAAEKDGYDWILAMDQDSVPAEDLISKYLRYIDMDKVALLTPYFDDENEADIIRTNIKPYDIVHRCNTSASLNRIPVWREIGGFDEEMFIDCVDFDYCTTLEEAGYRILRDNEAVVYHRLGHAQEIRSFMWIGRVFHINKLKKPFYTYNHSPLRTYYYARNIKYYSYKHRKTIDHRTETRTYIKWLVLKLFFEQQKYQKLKAILKGRKDANKMIQKLKSRKF